MSSFTWLDYSERERRQMLDVIDLFKEHSTRDELGLGSVRDAFADQFFPGTSTIMTRARYFLLVPWTYIRLEAKKVGFGQVAERARRAETDLIEGIENSSDSRGNIGKYAKRTLKRLPSSVYWQGLELWGIRLFAGDQAQYHRGLDRYYQELQRHGRRALERSLEHDDLVLPNWHPALDSLIPEDFPANCSLTLSAPEAEYLRDRIRLSPRTSGSLLAELVTRRHKDVDVAFAWEHPFLGELPESHRELLLHARNFSETMLGAALLYNLILAERIARKESVSEFSERLSDWAEQIAARASELSQWPRQRFWELVAQGNPRVTSGTRAFIESWWDLVLSGSAQKLRDSQTARQIVNDRERRLKKNLARIDNPRARELWNGDSGSGQLEFRWAISQQLLADIFQGLEGGAGA